MFWDVGEYHVHIYAQFAHIWLICFILNLSIFDWHNFRLQFLWQTAYLTTSFVPFCTILLRMPSPGVVVSRLLGLWAITLSSRSNLNEPQLLISKILEHRVNWQACAIIGEHALLTLPFFLHQQLQETWRIPPTHLLKLSS